jgi:hypothetical protein
MKITKIHLVVKGSNFWSFGGDTRAKMVCVCAGTNSATVSCIIVTILKLYIRTRKTNQNSSTFPFQPFKQRNYYILHM